MKSLSPIFFLGAFVFFLIVTSCSKSSNSSKGCDFSNAAPAALDTASQVIYVAGITGSASGSTITKLSYQDSAGITSITNPTLPWAKIVNLQAGVIPSISAKGTAAKGDTLNIAIAVKGTSSISQCTN
jgi:hypothetical protein